MMMKHYYTAREAQQQLGINVGAFYYLVETGKLKKLTLPGKKQGFYSKYQIERLAGQNNSQAEEKESAKLFQKATLADMYEEYELATLMLKGSGGYSIPTYQAWMRKNAETHFIVRDQNRLVAFLHVLPLKQETIKKWASGIIREWEISAEDVLPYVPGTSVECIIMGIATTSDTDQRQRRVYGAYLIRGYLRFLSELAKQGVVVNKLHAAGTTPESIAFLKQARFVESGQVGKRTVFEYNPLASEDRIAQEYRAILDGTRSC